MHSNNTPIEAIYYKTHTHDTSSTSINTHMKGKRAVNVSI